MIVEQLFPPHWSNAVAAAIKAHSVDSTPFSRVKDGVEVSLIEANGTSHRATRVAYLNVSCSFGIMIDVPCETAELQGASIEIRSETVKLVFDGPTFIRNER